MGPPHLPHQSPCLIGPGGFHFQTRTLSAGLVIPISMITRNPLSSPPTLEILKFREFCINPLWIRTFVL